MVNLDSILFYRLGKLTWHDGLIPEGEIWMKLGGDKGGSTFKLNIQILNIQNPNSKKNTCVTAMFEASDTITNLHIALDRYSEQVSELQRLLWR